MDEAKMNGAKKMDEKKKEVKKPIAVVQKNQRDPFLDYKPAAWKRPYYFAEDCLEKSLTKVDAICYEASQMAELKNINILLVSYIVLTAIVLLTLVSAAIRKVGFFF